MTDRIEHDVLARATRALREETELGAHDGTEGLRRLEAALDDRASGQDALADGAQGRRGRRVISMGGARRARRIAWLVAAALVLGVSLSIAGVPKRVGVWLGVIDDEEAPSLAPAARPASSPPPARPTAPNPSAHEVREPGPEPSAPPGPVDSPAAPPPARVRVRVPSEPLPTAPEPRTTNEKPAETDPPAERAPLDTRAVFRSALNAQKRGDCEGAVRDYDRYLRAAPPSDAFVLEARWGRATCLVTLGRRSDARRALEPFARGRYGEYRKRDATQLLEGLGAP